MRRLERVCLVGNAADFYERTMFAFFCHFLRKREPFFCVFGGLCVAKCAHQIACFGWIFRRRFPQKQCRKGKTARKMSRIRCANPAFKNDPRMLAQDAFDFAQQFCRRKQINAKIAQIPSVHAAHDIIAWHLFCHECQFLQILVFSHLDER